MRLFQEVFRPRWGLDLVRAAGAGRWTLHLPRPDVDRMEYSLELVHADGSTEHLLDPFNDKRAGGPFGDRSVVEFPGYSPPAWMAEDAPPGDVSDFDISSRALRTHATGSLWSSAGADPDQPLPLLVVHDGPEYAQLSGLIHLLDVLRAQGRVPPMRAALLQPTDRDETLSASAAYSRALAHEILPKLMQSAPTPHGRTYRIGMGASLGALAMLHTHRRYPATFGGLFLQSGSFFRQRYDKQESGFPRFRRIARFVGQVLTASEWQHPIPVTITCGSGEENLMNNRAVRDALVSQDYDVSFVENRDAHNWVAWRDAFEPGLSELLSKAWG